MKKLLIILAVFSSAGLLAQLGPDPAPPIEHTPPEELAARAGAPPRDLAYEQGILERGALAQLTVGDWNYVMARMPYVSGYEDFSRPELWYFGAPDNVISALSMAVAYQPGLVSEFEVRKYLLYVAARANSGVPYVSRWTQPLSAKTARNIIEGLETLGIRP